MNLSITKASLTRDRCVGCNKDPRHENAHRLWASVRNANQERLFNLCESCAEYFARQYLQQYELAQRAVGLSAPPAPFALRPTSEVRRRRHG